MQTAAQTEQTAVAGKCCRMLHNLSHWAYVFTDAQLTFVYEGHRDKVKVT